MCHVSAGCVLYCIHHDYVYRLSRSKSLRDWRKYILVSDMIYTAVSAMIYKVVNDMIYNVVFVQLSRTKLN